MSVYLSTLHGFQYSRPLNNAERKQGSYSIVDVQQDRHEIRVKERSIPTALPKVRLKPGLKFILNLTQNKELFIQTFHCVIHASSFT